MSGTYYTNKSEFAFSFWASLYGGNAATPLDSRGPSGGDQRDVRPPSPLWPPDARWRKWQAETDTCSAGDTSDLLLDCGGTVSFTESFVYLGSLLRYNLSDHHDVEARLP